MVAGDYRTKGSRRSKVRGWDGHSQRNKNDILTVYFLIYKGKENIEVLGIFLRGFFEN